MFNFFFFPASCDQNKCTRKIDEKLKNCPPFKHYSLLLQMPGETCALPQCETYGRHKLSIFKIPNREGDFYEECRANILNVLIKYHVKDNKLKEKIKQELFIFAKHSSRNQILNLQVSRTP